MTSSLTTIGLPTRFILCCLFPSLIFALSSFTPFPDSPALYSDTPFLYPKMCLFHPCFCPHVLFSLFTGQHQFNGFRGVHWYKGIGWPQPGNSPTAKVTAISSERHLLLPYRRYVFSWEQLRTRRSLLLTYRRTIFLSFLLIHETLLTPSFTEQIKTRSMYNYHYSFITILLQVYQILASFKKCLCCFSEYGSSKST